MPDSRAHRPGTVHTSNVLLELDAGERLDEPETLWCQFDALNVACGGHAGDPSSMMRVVTYCAERGIGIGAHPSYPDRDGFGRVTLTMPPDAIADAVEAQCRALASIASSAGVSVGHVKPHGALYHDAATQPAIAEAIAAAVMAVFGDGAALIGPPQGALCLAARAHGLRYLREGFADRGIHADGSLIPRGHPGALLTDPREAALRAQSLDGEVDALCIHGDTPGALEIARAVRVALRGEARDA